MCDLTKNPGSLEQQSNSYYTAVGFSNQLCVPKFLDFNNIVIRLDMQVRDKKKVNRKEDNNLLIFIAQAYVDCAVF